MKLVLFMIGLIFSLLAFASASSDTALIRKAILDTAEKIAHYETVDEAVGPGPILTAQFYRFEFLMNNATLSELILLTNNNSPNVRAYSFWALAIRKYKRINGILRQHLNDTEKITLFVGCVKFPFTIRDFYLQVLSPDPTLIHLKGTTLTLKEIDFYRNNREVGR